MPLNFAMSLMTVTEFLFWSVLGFLFWKKQIYKRFPAMGTYLVLRVVAMPVLLVLLYGQSQHWFNDYCFLMYFIAYWSIYIASAILLYFVTIEIFRSVLSSYSGIMRLGTVAFRWAALVSLIVSLTSVSYTHGGVLLITHIAYALMRSVSIMELCLLAFLCFSMNALHISVRQVGFGIALGFGLMSSNDFVVGSLLAGNSSLISSLQFVNQALTLVSLGIWVTYCALPEPACAPLAVPANSRIYRWNEIAAALGHGTQVAVQQPAAGFFLSDVEKVVDKVLARNLQNSESKS